VDAVQVYNTFPSTKKWEEKMGDAHISRNFLNCEFQHIYLQDETPSTN